jgi:hypothetical protein
MRRAVVGLVLVGSMAGLRAQTPTALDTAIEGGVRFEDPRVGNHCQSGASLHQIALQGRLLYGFENTSDCWLGRATYQVRPDTQLTASTPREALDRLIAAMPGFQWKEIDGVVVVRPTTAWADPDDVLNLPTAAFRAPHGPFNDALHTALRAVTPPLIDPSHEDVPHSDRMNSAASVTFRGGSLLEALNELVRARHDAFWRIGYNGAPRRGDIALGALEARGGGIMAQIMLPRGSSR